MTKVRLLLLEERNISIEIFFKHLGKRFFSFAPYGSIGMFELFEITTWVVRHLGSTENDKAICPTTHQF